MRTTVEENAELGKIVAEKANAAQGPVEVFLPLQGISIVDSVTDEGPQPFWWPEADRHCSTPSNGTFAPTFPSTS